MRCVSPQLECAWTKQLQFKTKRLRSFLREFGLGSPMEFDELGFAPLHYAALAGDTAVMRGLLRKRADVAAETKKRPPGLDLPEIEEKLAGIGPGIQAVHISAMFGWAEAVALLISQKASANATYRVGM